MTKGKTIKKETIGAIAEGLGPEVAKELLDIAEKLVVAKRLSKDLKFQCPHCNNTIDMSVNTAIPDVSFTLKENR